jgi:large subunit ribosomal protein L10
MALTRAKKVEKVEALAAELQGSTSAIVGTFTKLTVAQDFQPVPGGQEQAGQPRI